MQKVNGQPRPRPASAATWLIVILLSVIATCLVLEAGISVSSVQAQPASGGVETRGLIVVAGQVTPDSYGLYLVDPSNGTIAVYQYLPNIRKLRLVSARYFGYDVKLDEYNTEPSVREIRTDVEERQRLKDIPKSPATRPQQ